MNHPDTAGY